MGGGWGGGLHDHRPHLPHSQPHPRPFPGTGKVRVAWPSSARFTVCSRQSSRSSISQASATPLSTRRQASTSRHVREEWRGGVPDCRHPPSLPSQPQWTGSWAWIYRARRPTRLDSKRAYGLRSTRSTLPYPPTQSGKRGLTQRGHTVCVALPYPPTQSGKLRSPRLPAPGLPPSLSPPRDALPGHPSHVPVGRRPVAAPPAVAAPPVVQRVLLGARPAGAAAAAAGPPAGASTAPGAASRERLRLRV